MPIIGVDHVQLAIPAGGEGSACERTLENQDAPSTGTDVPSNQISITVGTIIGWRR
jgi:hypothetical protein